MDKSREAGCTAYLAKPIRRQTLLEALEKYSEATHAQSHRAKASERVPAVTDERLRALVPAYLEGRRRDIRTILTALEQGDYEQICTVGHKLHGSGAGYGFPEMSALGQRLEWAAERRDANHIREHATELSKYLDGLEMASRDLSETPGQQGAGHA